jgi:hypothetical protein
MCQFFLGYLTFGVLIFPLSLLQIRAQQEKERRILLENKAELLETALQNKAKIKERFMQREAEKAHDAELSKVAMQMAIEREQVWGFLLVTRSEYPQSLASYWSHVRNILSPWLPIGHTFGAFSVPGVLLVTRSEYSHSLASYWSHVRNILISWLPIGHTFGIFSVPGFL